MICIVCCLLMALGGSLFRPDDTKYANDQHLELSCLPPKSKVKFFVLKAAPHLSLLNQWWQGGAPQGDELISFDEYAIEGDHILFKRLTPAGKWNITYTASLAELGLTSSSLPADRIHVSTYWLGTDKYGRDVLSRLMAGTYISLAVGAIAVLISLLLGILIGLAAGYYRGWVDAVLMWFTNVIWSIPTLLLVMAITFVFGTGFWKVFLAVGLTMWVEVARIARGQVLSIREKEYIEAARAMGFSDIRIMLRHILPNITSPIIVISAANFASAILIEAGLSFMGLGAQIPVPSWGNMIREHYSFITTDMAFLALAPGICIMLLVLAFMLVGNGLRDALDVKS